MSFVTSHSHDATHTTWGPATVQVSVCTAIALYNSLELVVLVLTTFKEWNWKSLYFDSILIASLGLIPYNIGFLLEYFYVTAFWVAMTFSSVGWVMLITGQSLVLYSRLNLVFTNDNASRWILKMVKWMIIIDAILFHTSITVMQYGTQYGSHQHQFVRAIFYGERIQMTGFCLQEFIISGLYVWKTIELLKVITKQGTRRVILGLFLINVLIIAMDIGLLVLEYRDLYALERAWKPFVYSVKLKLEFVILGKLVDLVQSNQRNLSSTLMDVNSVVVADSANVHSIPTAQKARFANPLYEDTGPKWVTELDEEGKASHVEHTQIHTH